jgi:hypothetical protein
MFTLSLNVFIFLNACGLYNACMSYVKGVYRLVTESDKSLGNKKVCYNMYLLNFLPSLDVGLAIPSLELKVAPSLSHHPS